MLKAQSAHAEAAVDYAQAQQVLLDAQREQLEQSSLRLAAALVAGEPCLVLRRRTRSQGQVASVSALWHPASRYQFTGSF